MFVSSSLFSDDSWAMYSDLSSALQYIWAECTLFWHPFYIKGTLSSRYVQNTGGSSSDCPYRFYFWCTRARCTQDWILLASSVCWDHACALSAPLPTQGHKGQSGPNHPSVPSYHPRQREIDRLQYLLTLHTEWCISTVSDSVVFFLGRLVK